MEFTEDERSDECCSPDQDSFDFSESEITPYPKLDKKSAELASETDLGGRSLKKMKNATDSAHNLSVKGSCISAPHLKSDSHERSIQPSKQPNSFSLLTLPKKQQTKILELGIRQPRKSILHANLNEQQIQETKKEISSK